MALGRYTAPRGASKLMDGLKEALAVFVAAFATVFITAANNIGAAPDLSAASAFGRALFYGAIAALIKAAVWYATTQITYPSNTLGQ
jgi:hypothetical protein